MTYDAQKTHQLGFQEKMRQIAESLQPFLPTKDREPEELQAIIDSSIDHMMAEGDRNSFQFNEMFAQQAAILDAAFHLFVRWSGKDAPEGTVDERKIAMALQLQAQCALTIMTMRRSRHNAQRDELEHERNLERSRARMMKEGEKNRHGADRSERNAQRFLDSLARRDET